MRDRVDWFAPDDLDEMNDDGARQNLNAIDHTVEVQVSDRNAINLTNRISGCDGSHLRLLHRSHKHGDSHVICLRLLSGHQS